MEKHNRKKTRPELSELDEVFTSVTEQLDNFFVITDALDECSDEVRSQLLRSISASLNRTHGRHMATSRPNLKYNMGSPMTLRASNGDLERYMKSRMVTQVWKNDRIRQQALKEVMKNAEGVSVKTDVPTF